MRPDSSRSTGRRRWIVGLLLAVYSLGELRPFLGSGIPLAFDAHSHLTRAWLVARAVAAGVDPSWTFEWYGGFRLLEFYGPAYYLLTGALGALLGDAIASTRLVLAAGQLLSVVAFYGFLLRLGGSPLSALFGALLYLHDAQRWLMLGVIGNHPSLLLYAVAPLLLLCALRADGTARSLARICAARSLLLATMALGHLTNSAQVLPALLAFEIAWVCQRLSRAAARHAILGMAASLVALAAVTAFFTVPLLSDLQLVSLRLDTAGVVRPTPDLEPLGIALGLSPGSWQHIFVTSQGGLWCALAFGAGLVSLRSRHRRWIACFAGLGASLLSLLLLGDRAAIALILFVASLAVAGLEITSRALVERGRERGATLLRILAVAAVPLWHHARELPPLGYVDARELAVYERIPETGGPGRTFDVTPTALSVDGVYGESSFSPYWTHRAVPFGGFPQGAPLAVNVQLALLDKLVAELKPPRPELSADALDLLYLLHVEWLVDRHEPSSLAGLGVDASSAHLHEAGLLRLSHATPALFSPRLEALSVASPDPKESAIARLERWWEEHPPRLRSHRSLEALARPGHGRDWLLFLPLLRAMGVDRSHARAERLFVEQPLPTAGPAPAGTPSFALLAHRERLASVEITARASAPGFVRLAYSHDPELSVEIDGEPAESVADFLGGVVLAFPEGTHTIELGAPRSIAGVVLPCVSAAAALGLAILWIACRPAPPA